MLPYSNFLQSPGDTEDKDNVIDSVDLNTEEINNHEDNLIDSVDITTEEIEDHEDNVNDLTTEEINDHKDKVIDSVDLNTDEIENHLTMADLKKNNKKKTETVFVHLNSESVYVYVNKQIINMHILLFLHHLIIQFC